MTHILYVPFPWPGQLTLPTGKYTLALMHFFRHSIHNCGHQVHHPQGQLFHGQFFLYCNSAMPTMLGLSNPFIATNLSHNITYVATSETTFITSATWWSTTDRHHFVYLSSSRTSCFNHNSNIIQPLMDGRFVWVEQG